jgi:alcohol dehydrogenase
VLVRVRAVSLNVRDLAMLRGRYPRKSVPGLIQVSDAAGEIAAVGKRVAAFKFGDRVIGAFHPRWFGGDRPSTILSDSYAAESDGWLCELKAVSQEAVVRPPDALSYAEGSTLPCAGVTAWSALTGPAPIRAGRTALVQGSGGVSIFACNWPRAVGAAVIAATSSQANADQLKALGAAEVVN